MTATMILVGASTSVFGATVGFLIGLSQSPVVAVVLPLLFGLLGGTSGFFFASSDLAT